MKKISLTKLLGCVLLLMVVAVYVQSSGPSTISLEKEKVLEKIERYIERHRVADVKAVFEFFMDLFSVPTSPKDCRDGKYQGESIYDDYQYKHIVDLEIKDAKIIPIHYNEVKKDGHGKRGDKEYCTRMKQGSGASPAEVYPLYEAGMLEHQDLMKVDAVSGATYSLYRFRTAVLRALLKAKE
jgi:major membrane immunogen (membrane-anchored lipoprotein)